MKVKASVFAGHLASVLHFCWSMANSSLLRASFGGVAILGVLLGCSEATMAQTNERNTNTSTNSLNEPEDGMDENTRAFNIPLPTLGGKQFWTDYRWWNGWRVQYNSTLDHWRLISPNNIRRGWGGKQAMLEALRDQAAKEPRYQAPTHVVLLAHGLFRSSSSMNPIAEEWSRNEIANGGDGKSECISFAYASTRNSIRNHASAMREFLETLPGQPKLSFVGHSLGNIVFRCMVGDLQRNGDPTNILGRLDRAVMLGPPNNGSALAASLSRLGIFETVTGSTGQHLGPAWDKIQDELGIPPCPFAIVIGDISSYSIQNPLVEGASDGVVTVAEATLKEATEIRSYPSIHSFLMSNKDIVESTIAFLKNGSLGPHGTPVDPVAVLSEAGTATPPLAVDTN